jgi:hypothetical protein
LQQVEPHDKEVTLSYRADLPMTRFRVERAITLPADDVRRALESRAEGAELHDSVYDPRRMR